MGSCCLAQGREELFGDSHWKLTGITTPSPSPPPLFLSPCLWQLGEAERPQGELQGTPQGPPGPAACVITTHAGASCHSPKVPVTSGSPPPWVLTKATHHHPANEKREREPSAGGSEHSEVTMEGTPKLEPQIALLKGFL